MRKICVLAIFVALTVPLLSQTDSSSAPPAGDRPNRGQGRGFGGGGAARMGRGVAGQIAEIAANSFSVKTQDGKSIKVSFTDSTRFMSGQKQVKAADFKVGDDIMVGGTENSDGTWAANFVANRTEQMREFREGLGKQFVMGEVKAIDGTKLSIARPDGQTQVIEVDETTSFKRGRGESITLADIKVGDRVNGRGELKNGTFVPSTLQVGGGPGGPGGRRGGPPQQGANGNQGSGAPQGGNEDQGPSPQ